jgi:hypothetical protein
MEKQNQALVSPAPKRKFIGRGMLHYVESNLDSRKLYAIVNGTGSMLGVTARDLRLGTAYRSMMRSANWYATPRQAQKAHNTKGRA